MDLGDGPCGWGLSTALGPAWRGRQALLDRRPVRAPWPPAPLSSQLLLPLWRVGQDRLLAPAHWFNPFFTSVTSQAAHSRVRPETRFLLLRPTLPRELSRLLSPWHVPRMLFRECVLLFLLAPEHNPGASRAIPTQRDQPSLPGAPTAPVLQWGKGLGAETWALACLCPWVSGLHGPSGTAGAVCADGWQPGAWPCTCASG